MGAGATFSLSTFTKETQTNPGTHRDIRQLSWEWTKTKITRAELLEVPRFCVLAAGWD